jgi:prolyl-tRNA editing enzyme YbaK/EbsC (Cys-tRNA(Pro) deacylase)/predicted Fe-S protein YdhL (DUF1289 family)
MNALTLDPRPEGFRRVTQLLAQLNHPHAPVFLDAAVRTSQEAADALGVAVGRIAKSVIFRRVGDDAAVLVITSGDKRVDEKKVAALVGAGLRRADADFVKARTGFSIGGVAPIGHATALVTLIDRELLRFDEIWAAAGHPHGVFKLTPQQLESLVGAPVADVVEVEEPVASPCNGVCRLNAATGLCEGCFRTLDEIAAWPRMEERDKRALWRQLDKRKASA